MRTSHLVILPLFALFFVFFIYWLAVQSSPPKPTRTTPIAISQLEIVERRNGKSMEAILAQKADSSSATPTTRVHPQEEPVVSPFDQYTSTVQSWMYNKKPFVNEQYSFLPSDRIYIVLELYNLSQGEHLLSASWINPDRKTINKSEHTIRLSKPGGSHRSYFWLELMKNGPFTELFTGKEYKGKVYGQWEVQIHLDGQVVQMRYFTVRDV